MAVKAIIVGTLPLHACTLTSAPSRGGSGMRSAHNARCVQWEVGGANAVVCIDVGGCDGCRFKVQSCGKQLALGVLRGDSILCMHV